MSKAQPEFQLQSAVAEYLRTAHKGVLFLSDVRASMKLTIPQQVRSKKIQADDFAMPDMVIFEARHGYHGMFLELKAESPRKKDGGLKAGDHLARQYRDILALRERGYYADFYWDMDDVIEHIRWYLDAWRA